MRGEIAKDTPAVYMRALAYGAGAAIAGMILYAVFAITTGIILGYVSLAVGWMIGKAMIKGSGGIGGKRYQIAAALLTYAAVSMAAVPIWIHYAAKQKQTNEQKLAVEQRELEKEFGQQQKIPAKQPAVVRPSPAAVLMKLFVLGIASPFVELWEAGPSIGWVIGTVILFIGIRIAWRITAGKPMEIYGPFENSTQPAL